MERQFEVIHSGGAFFESPRWRQGRWWVSDMWRGEIVSVAPDGSDVRRELDGPARPSGLGWRPDGALLVVAQLDKRLLIRRPDGQTDVLADLAPVVTSPKCNELIVDGSGTAWIGSVNYDKPDDVVVRVDPGGHAEVAATGFHHTNGMAMTADGRTLLVAETFGARVTAYTVCDGKRLVDGRTWAELPGTGPDGCALDSNGRLWVADAYGHRCLLVAEGGEIVEEIAPPGGLQAYACMLGGPERRTLLMCCIPAWDMDQPKDGTAASLVATEVDVPADPRSLP